jgi:hypothetical protein
MNLQQLTDKIHPTMVSHVQRLLPAAWLAAVTF